MAPPDPSPPKPGRCWFQYSLRTLLILTTVVAALFAWWSYKARQQREAVAAIENAGGSVAYDFQKQQLEKPPHWPAWMVDAMGVDYFASVHRVSFLGKKASPDSELRHLDKLPTLEELWMGGTPTSDAGLEHLQKFRMLKVLGLGGTKITDVGLKHLANVTSLQELILGSTNVSDAGLEHLKGLTELQVLDLVSTHVTEEGVARLRQSLPRCTIMGIPAYP